MHPTPAIAVRSGGRSASVGDSLTIAPSTPIAIDIRAESLAGGALVVVCATVSATHRCRSTLVARCTFRSAPTPGYVRFELSSG